MQSFDFQPARLSYVILNYDKLGFDADDFHLNSRNGRCRVVSHHYFLLKFFKLKFSIYFKKLYA